MNKKIIIIIIFMIIFTLCSESKAYDNEITHKDITKTAVNTKKCVLDDYLKNNLGLYDGYQTMLNGNKIIEWLIYGAEKEDSPDCRATNHFHDPFTKVKDWQSSGLSDKGFESAII